MSKEQWEESWEEIEQLDHEALILKLFPELNCEAGREIVKKIVSRIRKGE